MVALRAHMEVGIGKKPKKMPKPKLLTYEDYARLTPPDSGHYELHNGTIIYMPSPSIKHQDVCGNIFAEIKFFLKSNKIGKVYIAPLDVTFTEKDTFQPDVLFVKQERLEQLEAAEKRIVGAPDFVVEVKSPSNSTKEMSYKRFVYESEIVHEYWYVNLEEQTVKQYENIDNEMRLTQTYHMGDTITSTVIKGFTLTIEDIFKID
jgi:Uma2 family endonuclease